MTIAAERYLAVCQPFKHNNFTRKKAFCIFFYFYIFALFFTGIATFEVSHCFRSNPITIVVAVVLVLRSSAFLFQ